MRHLLGLVLILSFISSAVSQPRYPIQGNRYLENHQIRPQKPTPAQKNLLVRSQTRSDSLDILNYTIDLDITNFSNRRIQGSCTVNFVFLEETTTQMVLDLLQLSIDSIQFDGSLIEYSYDGNLITIDLPAGLDTEMSHDVQVYYHGTPTVAASNFGGLAFTNNMAYNLGIGLGENPYNFGRSWFPCFDNFVERSTYDLNIISANGREAYCSGDFVEEVALEDTRIRRSYRINEPMTTYLVGIAVSDFATIESTHTGQYGTHPIQFVASADNIGAMDDSFVYLGDAIDAFESWYGPYIWSRVGFVLTPVGAMEHVHLIAYPEFVGISGPNFNQNRLMAHELAHHWWGNITTLSSPADMWIKEGNAEYCAHLFTEYVFGKEDFIEQMRSNQTLVLRTAHIEDDGFQPLSGIPYEQTYGVHTYNKGAAVLHNMRSYMGDSLFSSAQTAVLTDLAFTAVNAEEYRDYLSTVSGLDMGPFFDDWIFSPGYSNYELEEMIITPTGSNFEVEVTVQQKLRATESYHTNEPVGVTFFAADWTAETVQMRASDELSTATFTLPFEPVMTIINFEQTLNMGRMNRSYEITEPGPQNVAGTNLFTLNVENIPAGDSALLNVVHHWTGADETGDPIVEVSNTHYWSVQGILPDDFEMRSFIRFNGGENDLDFELLQAGIETVKMMYRPTFDSDWEIYPYAEISPFGNGGLARLEPILPGEYTLANFYDDVSTENILDEAEITISPNPTQDWLRVEVDAPAVVDEYQLQLYKLNGQLLREEAYPKSNQLDVNWSLAGMPAGTYVLYIRNGKGSRAVEVVVQ
ncbi:MAG: M1 family aminopeptidase [Bacteroidota bacterium]